MEYPWDARDVNWAPRETEATDSIDLQASEQETATDTPGAGRFDG